MRRGSQRQKVEVPCSRDPDFRPHRRAVGRSEHGQELAPQAREVVRKLLLRHEKEPGLSSASLEQFLPKGVALSREQRDLLVGLAGPSTAARSHELEALWARDYLKRPPTIEEFVDDDYYLGGSLHRTESNEGLWPSWREWLIKHGSLDSFLHNLAISGAIGIGKTLLMVILMLYRIALCACLRDPYCFYGLSLGNPIVFLLLSLSQDTLRATGWTTTLRLMGASPFFLEWCGYDPRRMHAGLEVLLTINTGTADKLQITLSGGSKGQHHIGRNVLCTGLDESNFRLEQDPQQYAMGLFLDLRTRMASRFQRLGGFMPGLSIVVSSSGEESCFTEQLIDQIEKAADPNGQLVVRQAIYRVKPGLRLCSWRFKVFFGLPNVEPAILPGCYSEAGEPIPPRADCPADLAQPHQAVPDGARWELVPGDFYEQFVRSPRRQLQQLSGISLGGSNRFFTSLADIHRCLELSVQEGVPVPTRAGVLTVSDEDDRSIWDDLQHSAFVRRGTRSPFEPVRHPQRLRYVHLDLATRGLAGMAVCHFADNVSHPIGPGGVPLTRLIVEYDFILTLAPGKTRPICFNKIFEFICWLRDECRFRFGLVTADSYKSEHMLQTLHAKGFNTGRQSVDREKHAYLAWQGGFQDHCIRLYRQAQLLKETAELIELESKIDHPPDGTKDTTDAAVGAYFNAISSEEKRLLAVPSAPPALIGISPLGNASPEDPFGFFSRIKPRQPHVHRV